MRDSLNSTQTSDGLSAEMLFRVQALIDLIRGWERDLDELPGPLMQYLVDLFKPDIASYYIREPFTSSYYKEASFPEEFWGKKYIQETFNRRPSKGGAIGKAVEQKEVVFIEDIVEAESKGEYVPIDPKIANEIVVPILAQGTFGVEEDAVFAIIILSRYAENEFSREEYQLIKIVGSIISTVYSNSLAKEFKEKRIEFLASIMDLQSVDLDVLFQNFLVALEKLIPSKFSSLWLYNELDDTLVIRSFRPSVINQKNVGFESLDRRVLDCGKCLSGEVIHSKRPKVFRHIVMADNFSNPIFANEHRIEWFISAPILDIDKNPLGVLNLCPYGDPEDFSEESLEALHRYISPIANTIRLASLLNEESLLFAYDDFFKNMLAFEDQQASWDNLAALIRTQMKCEACSIFLAEADGLLHLKGTTGIIGDPPYELVVYKPNEGLTGIAFTMDEPVFIYYKENKALYENIHISKYREKISGKSKSIIFVQILDKANRPIGIIRCNNKEETPSRQVGRFTKEDRNHLQKISKIISNAHWHIAWLREREAERDTWMREREMERDRSLTSLHHEILSPLEGIMDQIDWMADNFPDWKSPTDGIKGRVLLKLEDMQLHSKLIDVIVTSLGRFEEIKLKTKEVSLVNLLNTCRSFMNRDATKTGINITIDHIYTTRIRCDELQMMRVFFNILRNAMKYADPKQRQKYIKISVTYTDTEREYFILSFEDNGIGILPGEEVRIFQKYERGSNAAKFFPQGTGLGLAFCKSIMEKHGGQIFVDKNNLSKPTIFQLIFPKWMRV